MTVSKEDLLKASFGVEDFEIAGVGTVRIRPLTRSEAMSIRGLELPLVEVERKFLAWAMVEPKLTEDEIKSWQDVATAGSLEALVNKIAEISGMNVTRPKEVVKQFRG